MIIMWDTVYHEEKPHQPYICISRRDRESSDLWVQNYYLALMLEKPFDEIDSYAYKAKHSTLDAKVVFDDGCNGTPLLYLNETATMLVMDYCGAPEAAKTAVKKLFKEIAADKTIHSIAVFFDENWNEEKDAPARCFPWWTEKPRTLPKPEDLRDYSSETGYRESTDGFVIKAPTEPLTWDELEEWEALQIDALKKQNAVALDQTETKLNTTYTAIDQYCAEFRKNKPTSTKQEFDDLCKRVEADNKKCHAMEIERVILRTLYTCPACWPDYDRDIFLWGLCLNEAIRNNEIEQKDFFKNKEDLKAIAEKHYTMPSCGGLITASSKFCVYPIRKEEGSSKPEEQPSN